MDSKDDKGKNVEISGYIRSVSGNISSQCTWPSLTSSGKPCQNRHRRLKKSHHLN